MRRMVWIKTARTESWACSECGWRFSPSGPPLGRDLEEMKRNYERQRDEEYASHVCAKYPRASGARDDFRIPRRPDVRTHGAGAGGRGRNEMRREE